MKGSSCSWHFSSLKASNLWWFCAFIVHLYERNLCYYYYHCFNNCSLNIVTVINNHILSSKILSSKLNFMFIIFRECFINSLLVIGIINYDTYAKCLTFMSLPQTWLQNKKFQCIQWISKCSDVMILFFKWKPVELCILSII